MMGFVGFFIIILFSYGFIKLVNKNERAARFINGKGMIVGYVAVLVISLFVSIILVDESEDYSAAKTGRTEIDLDAYISRGKLYEIKDQLYQQNDSYNITGDTVTLKNDHADYLPYTIYIDRKNKGDHSVDVAFYTTNIILNEIDYADRLKPANIALNEGDSLVIEHIEALKVDLQIHDIDMLTGRFIGRGIFHTDDYIHEGKQALVITIPEGVHFVNDSDEYIEYLY